MSVRAFSGGLIDVGAPSLLWTANSFLGFHQERTVTCTANKFFPLYVVSGQCFNTAREKQHGTQADTGEGDFAVVDVIVCCFCFGLFCGRKVEDFEELGSENN